LLALVSHLRSMAGLSATARFDPFRREARGRLCGRLGGHLLVGSTASLCLDPC
jgi:hypothetical protein